MLKILALIAVVLFVSMVAAIEYTLINFKIWTTEQCPNQIIAEVIVPSEIIAMVCIDKQNKITFHTLKDWIEAE